MFCVDCGNEIPDDSNVCPFCGVIIEDGYEMQGTKKSMGKYLFLIAGIVLAAVVVIVAGVLVLKGRSIEKTVEKYSEAVDEEDEKLLYKLMFPNKFRKDAKDLLRDGSNVLEEMNDDVDDITYIGAEDADEKLKDRVEEIFDDEDLEIDYDDLKVVNLEIEYKKKKDKDDELYRMLAYSIGNKWYIVPGIVETCIEEWREEDIESAEKIGKAISAAMEGTSFYYDLKEYRGAAVDLESDLEYLPESVQTGLMEQLGKVPEIRYTWDGATGFVFVVNGTEVTVYASSKTSMTEWQLYPSVDDAYYESNTDKEDGFISETIDKEYTYAKLISSRSPILGYWQGDTIGMYIGYNTSGGEEGFTVYIQSQDFSEHILNSYANYSQSGDCGYVQYVFSSDGTTRHDTFKISVEDSGVITLSVNEVATNYGDVLSSKEYTLSSGEVGKNVLSSYEGTWIEEGGQYLMDEMFEHTLELSCCEECGSIHKKDYIEASFDCYHNNKYVSLYDGKTLHYLFPKEGLYVEGAGVLYSGDMYTLMEGEMEAGGYAMEGGSYFTTYYPKGSVEATKSEALRAYENYINQDTQIFLGAEFVCVDDDEIPECVVTCQYDEAMNPRMYMLTYYDGEIGVLDGHGTSTFHLKENSNELCYEYTGPAEVVYGFEFYTLEKGEFIKHAELRETYEDETLYYIDQDEVNETAYGQKLDSFGEYSIYFDYSEDTLSEAYDKFKNS